MITVRGKDLSGVEVSATFSIYVTITDGKTPENEIKDDKKEEVSFETKMMVEGYDRNGHQKN